jgi:hypothetical protein
MFTTLHVSDAICAHHQEHSGSVQPKVFYGFGVFYSIQQVLVLGQFDTLARSENKAYSTYIQLEMDKSICYQDVRNHKHKKLLVTLAGALTGISKHTYFSHTVRKCVCYSLFSLLVSALTTSAISDYPIPAHVI